MRIWHPEIDPTFISETLQMSPKRSWKVGERRSTPKGNLLKGKNKESYWTSLIHKEKQLFSTNVFLENYIENHTKKMHKYAKFLNEIRETSGRIEYFIGFYIEGNSGSVLPSSLLLSLGKLGIDLAFDVYPEK